MKVRDLQKQLIERHGAIARSEFHLQVPVGDNFHDIWFSKRGVKWRLRGDVDTQYGDPEELLAAIEKYSFGASDLGWLQSLNRFLADHKDAVGVFVDAGFKAGLGRLCIMRCDSDRATKDIHIQERRFEQNNHAEYAAIEWASRLWPGELIHSDCEGAVQHATSVGIRAVWMSRKNNKAADKLANLRGGSK